MLDGYDVEVKLPFSDLSEVERNGLKKELQEEMLRIHTGKHFDLLPQMEVSTDGRVWVAYNQGYSKTDMYQNHRPQITHEDMHRIIKNVVERLLRHSKVELPAISFNTRYEALRNGGSISEDDIREYIRAHSFYFRKPSFISLLFGRTSPSEDDMRLAESRLISQRYQESLEQNIKRLERFEAHLEPFAEDLRNALRLYDQGET